MKLAGGRRDGVERIALASVPSGRIRVVVGSGRVELGYRSGQQVRVRWTVPARLPARWLKRLRPQGLRCRPEPGGLVLRARRARLRIDLPDGVDVTVELRRGEITSWGAGGELDLASRAGPVSCRELRCRTLTVRAARANLHFASPPERVEVTAPSCVLALPGGPYRVTAPAGALVEVEQAAETGGQVRVWGTAVRILAATAPLSLRGDSPGEPAAGS